MSLLCIQNIILKEPNHQYSQPDQHPPNIFTTPPQPEPFALYLHPISLKNNAMHVNINPKNHQKIYQNFIIPPQKSVIYIHPTNNTIS